MLTKLNVQRSDLLSVRDRQCKYKSNSEGRSCNHCCSGKVISITHSAHAFVALGVQHAKRMRRIILSSVACPALQYFSTLSHELHDYFEKCAFLWFMLRIWIFNLSTWNLSKIIR